jgi:hypothetical protein
MRWRDAAQGAASRKLARDLEKLMLAHADTCTCRIGDRGAALARWRCMRSLLVVAVLSAGCNLYWGHHGGDDVCVVNGTNGAAIPAMEVRDPSSGECVSGGGGYDCNCGPCPAGAGVLLPNGPSCFGPCEGLDEASCLSTNSCHAVYTDTFDSAAAPQYWECWDTTPAFGGVPPTTTDACATLDVLSCAFRDDCIGLFAQVGGPFEACAPEPAPMSCDLTSCPTDSHCEQQCTDATMCRAYCVPNDLCAAVTCGTGSACVETCEPSTGTCSATCVANTACAALATETACKSRTDCEPVYKGDDCTCLPDGCTCSIETYERCQSR